MRRSTSACSAGLLLPLALAATPAQGPPPVEHVVLGASAQGLELWAPDGAAVLQGPFTLQVRDGVPGAPGVLAIGFAEDPLYLPPFDATIYPALPVLQLPFVLDGLGASPELVGLSWLDPALAGVVVVAQGAALDASAPGGLAFSNGLRMVAGVVDGPYLPAPVTPLAGKRSGDVVAADVDHDGDVDLVIRTEATYDASVLLGAGNGELEAAPQAFLGAGESVLAAADLNGDGDVDLVDQRNLVPAEHGGLHVSPGHGDGTFGPVALIELVHALDVALGDLDGDGALDAVVTEASLAADAIRVFVGLGDGGFQPSTAYPTGLVPGTATLADLDLDGALDVAAGGTGFGTSGIRVLRGNGDGTLQPEETVLADWNVVDLEAADLDGDLAPDLVTSDGTVLLGTGTGAFGAPSYGSGTLLSELTLTDLDGDGLREAVGLDATAHRVEVRTGLPGGAFGPAEVYQVGGDLPQDDHGLAVADVDGDGAPDAALAPWYPLHVSGGYDLYAAEVHFGDGAGGFHRAGEPLAHSAFLSETLLAEDLDGDGRRDFAAAGSFELAVHLALPGGAFQAPVEYGSGGGSRDLRAADLDADGDLDLALVNPFQGTLGTLLGDGGGAFAPIALHGVAGQPARLALGDVDGDGLPDAVTSALELLPGDGAGGFGPSTPLGGGVADVLLADLDLDGDLDVAGLDAPGAEVSVLAGNGDGTFAPAQGFAVGGAGPVDLAAGDVDLDGALDLATANGAGRSVSVLRNVGAAAFAAPDVYAVPEEPLRVQVADLLGNGHREVVALQGELVTVLAGGPGGALGPAAHHSPLHLYQELVDLAVADLSGDGIKDVLLIDGGGAAQRVRSQLFE